MYERFIARQPILDGKLKLFGYELLFRAREDTRAGADPKATAQLIVSSTMLFDWNTLLDGACAAINFGAEELLNGAALLLPSEKTVIEVPGTLDFTEEILQGIKNLRLAGYRIALDGYGAPEVTERLLRYVNFVKVDFREARQEDHDTLRGLIGHANVRLIAKKIESWKEFEWAREQNYSYFQGHFFLEPQLLKRRDLAGSPSNCMQLLRLVHEREMNLPKIEEIMKQEPALMYKLLRFLNSPGAAVEVKSVHSAIALLGDDEFRRWASLVTVITPAAEKPGELIRTGLTRGFFCERLARVSKKSASPFEYFLTGLFSVMSALLDRPLADIVAELAVSGSVRDALAGKANELRHALDAAVAFEGGKWEEFARAMDELKLDERNGPECMEEAARIVRELRV